MGCKENGRIRDRKGGKEAKIKKKKEGGRRDKRDKGMMSKS